MIPNYIQIIHLLHRITHKHTHQHQYHVGEKHMQELLESAASLHWHTDTFTKLIFNLCLHAISHMLRGEQASE
jgi:hypothetical protein